MSNRIGSGKLKSVSRFRNSVRNNRTAMIFRFLGMVAFVGMLTASAATARTNDIGPHLTVKVNTDTPACHDWHDLDPVVHLWITKGLSDDLYHAMVEKSCVFITKDHLASATKLQEGDVCIVTKENIVGTNSSSQCLSVPADTVNSSSGDQK